MIGTFKNIWKTNNTILDLTILACPSVTYTGIWVFWAWRVWKNLLDMYIKSFFVNASPDAAADVSSDVLGDINYS